MSAVIRTITGTLNMPNGSAWENARVDIYLCSTVAVDDDVYPINRVQFTTDGNGDVPAGTTLAVPSSGTWQYNLVLPDRNGGKFYMGGSGDLDMAEIVAAVGAASTDHNPLVDYPPLPGEIRMYGGAAAPAKWLLCNGAAVSRTTYDNLFAIISTTFGAGDGSTTFNLPDMQGRIPVGAGSGAGLTARTLADTGGTETHQLTTSELPAHNHTFNQSDITATSHGGNPGWYLGFGDDGGRPEAYFQAQTQNSLTSYHNDTIGSTGNDTAHENMPPFLALNYIIRY